MHSERNCFELQNILHTELRARKFIEKSKLKLSRSRIHERAISLRFLGIILKVIRLQVNVFPYTIFTLQSSFKPILLKFSVDVTVNSK
jgi:hypothetical protein